MSQFKSLSRLASVLVATAAVGFALTGALAQQVSPPVVLQWFENSWQNVDRRVPDYFSAGYGALWTPPPGRALYTNAGGGIGYDVYDRFDLGKPGDPTLYGTELGYRTLVRNIQKTGGSVYVDFVHHHVGSFDIPGYTGPNGGGSVQTRSDYPGFLLSNVGQLDGDSYPNPPPAAPGSPQFEYQYRLANLITVNFTASNPLQFVRNPVPGYSGNVPQSTANWAVPTATALSGNVPGASLILRQANTPSFDNRRFYPDRNGPSRTVIDGGVSYTVYDFNLNAPHAGDPVAEGVSGYMMRYAQWMVQYVGVDGLRIDAARHVPFGDPGDPFNPTQVNVPHLIDRAVAGASFRKNLDGSQRSVFQFQEVFSGDINLLTKLTRKTNPPGDTVFPNRDVLDFPMWFAMRSHLSNNTSNNNWHQIRNASFDFHDDGNGNNGSQGIGFVYNHDEGGLHLDNVAHAWILMRPGNAYVYFRGNEWDGNRHPAFFLKQGRGDALGGQYGQIITRLVDARNSYGRGNFVERYIDDAFNPSGFSNVYAFERQGSAIVGLNSSLNNSTNFDERTMYAGFAPGTRLIELTGNADNPTVDPGNQIASLLVVQNTDNPNIAPGRITMRIPRNKNTSGVEHGLGYVIYGLPRPVGNLTIVNKAYTIAGETPTPATNSTARLSEIDVVTAPWFAVRLSTNKVVLADGYHDHLADGDRAYVKINDGFDVNANGSPDFPSGAPSNATKYGFENFTTINQPGHNPNPALSGNGLYVQNVDVTRLGEGYHYVTVRAFRKTGPGESEVFTDFRRTIYIDREVPKVSRQSFSTPVMPLNVRPVSSDVPVREVRIRSDDMTATSVHVLMNLPAGLSQGQVLAMLSSQTESEQIDRDLFSAMFANVGSGNHVATVVTYEITGNFSITRMAGLFAATSMGRGFGDLDFDNVYAIADMAELERVLLSGNLDFNPAADVTGDGLVTVEDIAALGSHLQLGGASPEVMQQYTYLVNTYVPEPSGAAVLLFAAALSIRRRTAR